MGTETSACLTSLLLTRRTSPTPGTPAPPGSMGPTLGGDWPPPAAHSLDSGTPSVRPPGPGPRAWPPRPREPLVMVGLRSAADHRGPRQRERRLPLPPAPPRAAALCHCALCAVAPGLSVSCIPVRAGGRRGGGDRAPWTPVCSRPGVCPAGDGALLRASTQTRGALGCV